MKRIMVFWLVFLLPIIVFAKEYEMKDIDIKLNVDDDFIVLTRYNLDYNTDLDKVGVTKDYLENVMENNNIYFDIIKPDLSYEILVVVPKTTPLYKDLREATEEELKVLKETIVKQTGDSLPIVYKNDYAFIVVDYKDKNGYNIINYYTVINSRGYNIQLQKKDKITEEDKEDLSDIIDSIVFNENKENENNKKPFDYKIILYGAIIGLMAGIITYVIGSKIIMKKSSK
jgi:hypothetical protein